MAIIIFIAAIAVAIIWIVRNQPTRCECGQKIAKNSVVMHDCTAHDAYVIHRQGKLINATTQSESRAEELYRYFGGE